MTYDIVKSLHIIFVVSWFAGLFYMPRLFIYHTEAQEKDKAVKKVLSDQFKIMEKKLWWIITTPAMVLTLIFGTWMLILNPTLLEQGWMHTKLAFVVFLLIYHFVSQRLMFQMAEGIFKWKSKHLRLWNEAATLCLVAIIFLVELQNRMPWWKATFYFFLVAISLMLLIKLYKKISKK
ncbi:MAG: protoporphyrinogen oxidase HemJ [Crocinitomicaceae bacterium]|jgi:protoporphyrinogen IX oxidase|nr:protoporphyrinogen oxidase HemJ [Crocinitomicaceae bacterium]